MLEAIKHAAHKLLAHAKEHKLLYGVGAIGAGLGYLFVSSQASAAPPPKLPGTKGATPIPGGGINVATPQGNVVIPPPPAALTGNALYVTTKEPAPNGNLKIHSGPGLQYPQTGYYPKDGAVAVLGGPENNMMHVQGPGVDMQGNVIPVLAGWASADYLKPGAANPLISALGSLHDLGFM